jgi:hypothetical protein
MGCLVDALSRGYRVLGFDQATAGDEAFFQLVLARIIEPVSKLDSLRVLEEAGVTPAPYRTVTRRLRVFAEDSWRQQISAACAAHTSLRPASLVLYDCSTLYFETDEGDGFRESGFSKERRLEPQITIGLLTGADGFPAEHANAIQSRAVSPPGCRPRVRRPPPLRSARVRVRERAAGRRSLRRLGRSTQLAPRYTALSSPTSVMIRDVCCVVSGAKTRAVGVLPGS